MPEGVSRPGRGRDGTTITSFTSSFRWPEKVPWSELGGDFIETWGRKPDGSMQGEHVEASGQSGSGKSYAIGTILQQRAARYDTAELGIVTKQADDSIPLLGWPEVHDFAGLRSYRQAIFWPRTELQGDEKERYHEQTVYDLLSKLWRPDANTVLYFDEVRYLEGLQGPPGRRNRLKKLIRQYWREGRSHGFSLIAGAQRPIGMVRDQHSESRWKLVWPPADDADLERFAQLLGHWRDWAPVLDSLDQRRHEFVLRNSFTKDAYITWVDSKLRPLPSQQHQQDAAGVPPGAPYGPRAATIATSA